MRTKSWPFGNFFPGSTWTRHFLNILFCCTIILPVTVAQETEQSPKPPDIGLHLAALQGNLEAVRQHIQAGSDLNAKDAFGSIPLMVAITFGKADVARALISGGADCEIKDTYGSTPLQFAALLCRTEIVRALLDKGVNRYVRNRSGATAYDLVATSFEKDREIYDQLVAGLGPLGFTLDYAFLQKTRQEIAEMLRPSGEDLEAVDYTPFPAEGWGVSSPGKQGLDPLLVAGLYLEAAEMENLYGLLVFKNGYCIAEKYFNEGAVERRSLVQSVSKSYISALVGIALDKGCIASLDQNMMDFFPEFAEQIRDPRKKDITIRHLLEMRGGYLWEETDTVLWKRFVEGDHLPLLVDIALANDPGAAFNYSNLSSYLLGVIVARACDADLKFWANENLLMPIGSEEGDWYRDDYGYYYSFFGFTARDMAKLGLLYLGDGRLRGKQILSSEWVEASLQNYSDDAWVLDPGTHHVGRYFSHLGYGYQWWSASVGERRFDFAWGHGGQLIVLLDQLDMVIVVSSDPLYRQHHAEAWRLEQANFNLTGKFIRSLPIQ